MATTIEVPDEVLDKAKRVSPDKSAQEVVVRSLEEYARQHDQSRLIKFLGTFDDFMTPEELDAMRRER